MVDQSRVSDPKQGEEGIPIRRQQWQPGMVAGVWEGRESQHTGGLACRVSEPNQDEETAQEDHPVCSIQVG